MYTRTQSRIFAICTAIAMCVGVMTDSRGQGRPIPNSPGDIVGPIIAAPATPTYAALGNCDTLAEVYPGEVKVIHCIFQPPVITDFSDVVLATVSTGTKDIQGWVITANAPLAQDFSHQIGVDVGLRNLTNVGPLRATLRVAATIFYVPKSTTPVAVTTGAD
jgi:hypothetical protein